MLWVCVGASDVAALIDLLRLVRMVVFQGAWDGMVIHWSGGLQAKVFGGDVHFMGI